MVQFLFGLLIFTLPMNLFLKFVTPEAYVHGLLSDYLLPKLYVSDVVIFFLFAWWGREVWPKRKKIFELWQKNTATLVAIGSLIIALFIRQLFSPTPLASVWYFAKLFEIVLLAVFFWQHRHHFNQRFLTISLAFTLLFQSLVGLSQFIFQKSFFPSYSFFGEPRIEKRIGLATGDFNGVEKILPYGTTAHPNIFGGVLAIGILVLLLAKPQTKTEQFLFVAAESVAGYALWASQSVSAWLALGVGLLGIFLLNQKKLGMLAALFALSAVLFFFTPFFVKIATQKSPTTVSLVRRAYLNDAAVRMFLQSPLTGQGLNTFTSQVEAFTQSSEVVRFPQPAHHIGLLWLAEAGVPGYLLIGIFIWHVRKKVTSVALFFLIVFVPLAALDHYLLTQQTGLLLGAVGFFLMGSPSVTRSDSGSELK